MAVENSQIYNIESKKVVSTKQIENLFRVDAKKEKPVKRVVNVSCVAKITSSEKVGDSLNFTAVADYNVVYTTDENELTSVFASYEFKDNLLLTSEKEYFLNINVQDCQVADFSQTEIVLNALFNVEVSAISQDTLTSVNNLPDDYVVMTKNYQYNKVVNTIKEDIVEVNEKEVDYKVEEILYNSADIRVLNVSAGIDMLYFDAEIRVDTYVVSGGEIKHIDNKVNLKQEIAALSVVPESIVDFDADLNTVHVTISTSEIDNKTNLVYTFNINADAVVYSLDSMDIIEDAFSIKNKTAVNTECLLKTTFLGQADKITEISSLVELDRNVNSIIYPTMSKVGITEILSDGEDTKIAGVIELGFVVEDENNQFVNLRNYVPFTVNTERFLESNKVEIKAVISSYKLKNNNEIDVEFSLYLKIKNYVDEYVLAVSMINELEEQEKSDEAINVYVVEEKENLFNVAKNLCVKPQDILVQNNIEEDDIKEGVRLVVYNPLNFNF